MDGERDLLGAIWQDDVGAVQRLLEAGVDPNLRITSSDSTALMEAASVEAVELLLAAGANLNLVDQFGHDAFDYALRDRNADVARRLWQAGVDVDRRQPNGWTRLHGSVFRRNPVAVGLLLELGADPTLEQGRLLSAASWSDTEEEPGDTERTIDLLVKAGEDAHATDQHGYTALHCAVHPYAHTPSDAEWWNASSDGSDPLSARALLKHGADPNGMGVNGMTPLLLAAGGSYRAYACVEALLEAGADIEQGLFGGITPLMRAAHAGELTTVRVLLEHGADARKTDRWGHDAAHYARECLERKREPPDPAELPPVMQNEENLEFIEGEWKREVQEAQEIIALLGG